MKKYLLIATVAFGLSLTACGGGQKTETATPATEAAQPAVTAPTDSTATPTVSTDDVLAKYEGIINQAIVLQEKVAKGDAASAQELSKLSEQMTVISADLQKAAANLTPEQTQKLAELGKKWADAAAKAMPQPKK
jgi:hypothetical protein